MIKVRQALFSDHERITRVSRQSPYTRDFTNHIFSGEPLYGKGWIWVAVDPGDEVLGFSCVRHKVREPATVLYFIGVDKQLRGTGIGQLLLRQLTSLSPHPLIKLNCDKKNEEALNFYKRQGFTIAGESLKGHGWALERRQ